VRQPESSAAFDLLDAANTGARPDKWDTNQAGPERVEARLARLGRILPTGPPPLVLLLEIRYSILIHFCLSSEKLLASSAGMAVEHVLFSPARTDRISWRRVNDTARRCGTS